MSSQQQEHDQINKYNENRKSLSNTPNSALKSPHSIDRVEGEKYKLSTLESECDPINLSVNENDVNIGRIMNYNEDELETSPNVLQLTPSVVTNSETSHTETEADRITREQRESELLAWQMMQEESAELYQIQIRFMQEIAGDMSEEDVRALQDAINESGRLDLLSTRAAVNAVSAVSNTSNENDSDHSNEFDEDDENGNESSEVDDDPDEWDYDRLLDIGQQLGDVKTDRWRQRAPQVIAALPSSTYAAIKQQQISTAGVQETESTLSSPHLKKSKRADDAAFAAPSSSSSSSSAMVDYRCAICMGDFEENDMLNILPCGHYFHAEECCSRWLMDHNSCPTCKTAVAKD